MIHLLALLACAQPDATTEDSTVADDALDLRLTDADLPAAADNSEVWWGPEVTIEPGQDIMYCFVGTYNGPDEGIHTLVTYQNQYGHHLVVMGMDGSPVDYPDGDVFDCTTSEQLNMSSLQPLVLATSGFVGGVEEEHQIEMPDGMAVKIKQGQRYVIQAHYLNVSQDSFKAHDALVMNYLDPDTEVTTWAAPIVFNKSDFVLPAGEASTVSFDCPIEGNWSVFYMLAHMHEWGTSFTLDRVHADGNESIIDIPTWDPVFRDDPPTTYFAPGEFDYAEGDVMRTTCNWFNDTDQPLEFPHEMCDSVGLVYPQLTTVICDASE